MGLQLTSVVGIVGGEVMEQFLASLLGVLNVKVRILLLLLKHESRG